MTRLFEKTLSGLLVEIDPAQSDDARKNRRVSHMNISIDVLWTADEEAERDAEEAAVKLAEQEAAETKAKADSHRSSGLAKLSAIGLSDAEIAALIGK